MNGHTLNREKFFILRTQKVQRIYLKTRSAENKIGRQMAESWFCTFLSRRTQKTGQQSERAHEQSQSRK